MKHEGSLDDSNAPREPTEESGPGILLSEALGQLLEASSQRCHEGMVEQTMPLLYQVEQITTSQQRFTRQLQVIGKQLEVLGANSQLLENASKTNQLLGRQHYDEHVIQPLLRSIFPVFDLIQDARKHWGQEKEPIDQGTIDVIDAVWSQLQQFLATYDVHLIQHQFGEVFDPRQMKPVKWVLTTDQTVDGRVFESLQPGFQMSQGQMLRHETVSLLKYQSPSNNNTISLSERKEHDPRN